MPGVSTGDTGHEIYIITRAAASATGSDMSVTSSLQPFFFPADSKLDKAVTGTAVSDKTKWRHGDRYDQIFSGVMNRQLRVYGKEVTSSWEGLFGRHPCVLNQGGGIESMETDTKGHLIFLPDGLLFISPESKRCYIPLRRIPVLDIVLGKVVTGRHQPYEVVGLDLCLLPGLNFCKMDWKLGRYIKKYARVFDCPFKTGERVWWDYEKGRVMMRYKATQDI